MIQGEACFAIWAPDPTLWSQWAKPVLFASAKELPIDAPLAMPSPEALQLLPHASSGAAVVVDLPGSESVDIGLALAANGFRPVPLYDGTTGPSPVVDMGPLIAALGAGSQRLAVLPIPANAPPAFLLDSNRRGPVGATPPGAYDNRWVVLPQDFPSATLLASQGIREVTVVFESVLEPANDLAHVLRRWQEGGLALRAVGLAVKRVSERLVVPRPSFFRRTWYAAITALRLRRSDVGGFGSSPLDSSGG